MKVLHKFKRSKPGLARSSSSDQPQISTGAAAEEEKGFLVGHSPQGEKKVPVYLPPDALEHHTLLVGCLNTGKTTLLEHLTVAAMERGYGVVVIDSNDDLVPKLLKRVPKERLGKVYWLDAGDKTQGAGLNWLDITEAEEDTILNGFVHAAPRIWKEFWSPHVQDALMAGVKTLLAANATLVKWGEPQFTCQDLNRLFYHEDFRRLLLDDYVHDRELRFWWTDYWEKLPENIRLDLLAALLGRWQAFVQSTVIAKSLQQPHLDVPLAFVQQEGLILFVNQKTEAQVDHGRGALSSLILHRVLSKVSIPTERAELRGPRRLVVVMNGTQALPDLDILWYLGYLNKAGVSFMLSAQSLSAIPDKQVAPTLFAHVENLVVFRTTGHDAELIAPELDGRVPAQALTMLSDHECFVRTRGQHGRPQFEALQTLPPAKGDDAVATEIEKLSERYTRSQEEVEAERRRFVEHWKEEEAKYRQQMDRLKRGGEAEGSEDDPDDSEPSPSRCNS